MRQFMPPTHRYDDPYAGALLPDSGRAVAPACGVPLKAFLQSLGPDEQEFLNACPAPALIELPPEIGPEPRISVKTPRKLHRQLVGRRLRALLRTTDLDLLKIQFLVGDAPQSDVTVGRSLRFSDVKLSHPTVSRSHARFSHERPWWRVIDLESASGTRVEGQRLPVGVPFPVAVGQRLSFGELHTLFVTAPFVHALSRRYAQLAKNPLHRGIAPGGVPLRELGPRLSGATTAELADWRLPPFLLQIPTEPVASGADADRTLALCTRLLQGRKRGTVARDSRIHALTARTGGVVVGRSSERCDVVLDDASVSKLHAELRCRKGSWQIMDLESENGTHLDGKRLPAGIPTPLKPGATLWFGGHRSLFLLPEQVHELCRRLIPPSSSRAA